MCDTISVLLSFITGTLLGFFMAIIVIVHNFEVKLKPKLSKKKVIM